MLLQHAEATKSDVLFYRIVGAIALDLRIRFARVCGAMGRPKLDHETYAADRIEAQFGRYRPAVRQRPGAGGVGSPLVADVRFADIAMVRQGLCGSSFESEGGFDRRFSIPACE